MSELRKLGRKEKEEKEMVPRKRREVGKDVANLFDELCFEGGRFGFVRFRV